MSVTRRSSRGLVVRLSKRLWTSEDGKNNEPALVMMWDSHYFLHDKKLFDFQSFDSVCFVVGMEFPMLPGEYRLPKGTGTFRISGGKVTMHTTSSGEAYHHDCVTINHKDTIINPGFVQFFSSVVRSKDLKICRMWTPEIRPGSIFEHSVQDVWLQRY